MLTILKSAWRRLAAFFLDWLVIAGWGLILFGIVMFLSSGDPRAPSGPLVGEAIGFVSMTFPVVLYFAISERSGWRGTLGKRAMGLEVVGRDAGRISFRQAMIRNTIKFAPWEAGHLVAQQAFYSSDGGPALWVWLFVFVSMAGPFWWLMGVFSAHPTFYDKVAGTRVTLS